MEQSPIKDAKYEIPQTVFYWDGINNDSRVLFAYLDMQQRNQFNKFENKFAYCGIRRICDDLTISPKTAVKNLKWLNEQGLITIEEYQGKRFRGPKRQHVYSINWDEIIKRQTAISGKRETEQTGKRETERNPDEIGQKGNRTEQAKGKQNKTGKRETDIPNTIPNKEYLKKEKQKTTTTTNENQNLLTSNSTDNSKQQLKGKEGYIKFIKEMNGVMNYTFDLDKYPKLSEFPGGNESEVQPLIDEFGLEQTMAGFRDIIQDHKKQLIEGKASDFISNKYLFMKNGPASRTFGQMRTRKALADSEPIIPHIEIHNHLNNRFILATNQTDVARLLRGQYLAIAESCESKDWVQLLFALSETKYSWAAYCLQTRYGLKVDELRPRFKELFKSILGGIENKSRALEELRKIEEDDRNEYLNPAFEFNDWRKHFAGLVDEVAAELNILEGMPADPV